MRVTLLTCTADPVGVVATAAHTCVSSDSAAEFYNRIFDEEQDTVPRFFSKALAMGHTSILEHASFTFALEGVSRSLSHQLVRFRIASFSQQSQRYVRMGQTLDVVTPSSFEAHPDVLERFGDLMLDIAEFYKLATSAGIPAEDARFALPNATETALVMTMNARELIHACGLRCCTHAQWEIRDMFNRIKNILIALCPELFGGRLGAPCEVGKPCPEGPRSCGRGK